MTSVEGSSAPTTSSDSQVESTVPQDRGQSPPQYDPNAVGRIAAIIQIVNIELLGAHFERADEGAIPAFSNEPGAPELGIGRPEWVLDKEAGRLGCIFSFVTSFPEVSGTAPYDLIARFRLLYALDPGTDINDADIEQFVHWNAVFNAWPYWREYLASTINRAGLPRFMAPVMGVPRQKGMDEESLPQKETEH